MKVHYRGQSSSSRDLCGLGPSSPTGGLEAPASSCPWRWPDGILGNLQTETCSHADLSILSPLPRELHGGLGGHGVARQV
jgi:hypothetical protein